MKVCIDAGAAKMNLVNRSVKADGTGFDGVAAPANPDRSYLEIRGNSVVSQVSILVTFGEAYDPNKPSYVVAPGERAVFDSIVPVDDVYVHLGPNQTAFVFEGVPVVED